MVYEYLRYVGIFDVHNVLTKKKRKPSENKCQHKVGVLLLFKILYYSDAHVRKVF